MHGTTVKEWEEKQGKSTEVGNWNRTRVMINKGN